MPFIEQVRTCKPVNPISIKNTFWKAFPMLRGKYYGLRKPHDCKSTDFKLIWKTQVVKIYSFINDNSLECVGKGGLYWNESWGLLGKKSHVMSKSKTSVWSWNMRRMELMCRVDVRVWWGWDGGWGGEENSHRIRKLLKQRTSSSWRRTRHDPGGVCTWSQHVRSRGGIIKVIWSYRVNSRQPWAMTPSLIKENGGKLLSFKIQGYLS